MAHNVEKLLCGYHHCTRDGGGEGKESTICMKLVLQFMLHALLTDEAIRVHIWFCSVASSSWGLRNVTSLDSPCCALSMSFLEQGSICHSLLRAITSKPIILDNWGLKTHNTMKYIWVIQAKSNAVLFVRKMYVLDKVNYFLTALSHTSMKQISDLYAKSGEICKINPLVCANCNHPKLLRPRVDILSVLPLCFENQHSKCLNLL